MDTIAPVKPTPWPDAARFVAREADRLLDAVTGLRETLAEAREGYEAAQQQVAALEAHADELRDALIEARQALFHGAPVTVGLEFQINNAIRREV